MKTVLLLVLVLGFAMLGSAQTATPALGMTATAVTQDGTVTHLKGNVALAITGPLWVVADEADVTSDGNEIELRGNVRIRTSPR